MSATFPACYHLTVLDLDRSRDWAERTVDDIRRLLGRLDDIAPGIKAQFELAVYCGSASGKEIRYIEKLAELVIDSANLQSLELHHYLFGLMATHSFSDVPKFIDHVEEWTAKERLPSVPEQVLRMLVSDVKEARDEFEVKEGIAPPSVVWLPGRSKGRFEHGGHGISTVGLTSPKSVHSRRECILLCAEDYYFQIVWHECLHMLLELDDCYDRETRVRTCELPNCIMQWEPSRCDPGIGDWLCNRRKVGIDETVRQLKRRGVFTS